MISPGFLLIDKPAGFTSFDIVAKLRRLTGEKRIGHAGTLDPFATGLLLVAIGREATRELQKFVGLDKTYEATFVLGATSTTDDVEGAIEKTPKTINFEEKTLQEAISTFEGPIDQVPPTYAAIKVQGKKLYELAREGKPTLVEPRQVTIFAIEQLAPLSINTDLPRLSVRIHCSSGTYIRSIARDLGQKLGVGGYVETLRRTSIGPFSLDEAITLEQFDPSKIIPIQPFLSRLTT